MQKRRVTGHAAQKSGDKAGGTMLLTAAGLDTKVTQGPTAVTNFQLLHVGAVHSSDVREADTDNESHRNMEKASFLCERVEHGGH